MVLVAVSLGTAANPVYAHYLHTTGASALHDQRLGATIMWAGGLAAFAVPLVRHLRVPRRRPRAGNA
jgi:hypothetical protein